MNNPEEAEEWWSGKRFGLRKLKREARKRLSYDAIYGNLSEFVHANFGTIRFFWKPESDTTAIWITDYVPEYLYMALHGLLIFGLATLLVIVPTIFSEFPEEPLLKEIRDYDDKTKIVLEETLKKAESEEERRRKQGL